MNPANTHDMTAKVFMVGDFAVGKTNLLVRYCEGALFGQAPSKSHLSLIFLP